MLEVLFAGIRLTATLCLTLSMAMALGCGESSDYVAPSPVPFPAPEGTPPTPPASLTELCRDLRCEFTGDVGANGIRGRYRVALVKGGALRVRLWAANSGVRLTMQLGLCRNGGVTCWTSYEEFGPTLTLDLAANGLRPGDAVIIDVINSTPLPASYTLTTEVDDDLVPDDADASLCVPSLRSPANGAVLDNGRVDFSDTIVWDFDWEPCPGAELYDVQVMHRGASGPAIAEIVYSSSYRHESCGYIVRRNLTDWTWRVRARTLGEWGNWSEERTFSVELTNTDPSSRTVSRRQGHHEHRGRRRRQAASLDT